MSIGLYASKIQSEVLAEKSALEIAYRDFPDSNYFWCMVDLSKSTNYRLTYGPEKGYIRSESFFSLVRSTLKPYNGIRIFKEMGDAVLICSADFRPLFEACILMNFSAKLLSFLGDDANYPFEIRIGIEFGSGKKINRRNEDYLSESIDRLSRLMMIRSERSNFILGEYAFPITARILEEYNSICQVSLAKKLLLPSEKKINEDLIYRELYFIEKGVADFSDRFAEWKRIFNQK